MILRPLLASYAFSCQCSGYALASFCTVTVLLNDTMTQLLAGAASPRSCAGRDFYIQALVAQHIWSFAQSTKRLCHSSTACQLDFKQVTVLVITCVKTL